MNSLGPSGSRNAGFSLIEVLCAILILGVALAGLTQGVTMALSSTKESELQTTGALMAAGLIETIRAEGLLVDGTKEGEGEEGLSLYRWRETISQTPITGLHEVEVVIEHSKTGKEIYDLKTLLFEPTEDSSPTQSRRNANDARKRRSR